MNATRDELLGLIDELRGFDGRIVVEGKKDVAALAAFGIRAIELADSADVVIERLANEGADRIAILTDRDAEGRKLAAQIRMACERVGMRREPTLRRRFFAVTGLRQVEGFDTLSRRVGVGSGE